MRGIKSAVVSAWATLGGFDVDDDPVVASGGVMKFFSMPRTPFFLVARGNLGQASAGINRLLAVWCGYINSHWYSQFGVAGYISDTVWP